MKKSFVMALIAIYLWAPFAARAGDRITAEMAMAATDKAFAQNVRAAETLHTNVNVLEGTLARIDPLVLEYRQLDSENDAKRERIAREVHRQLCIANQNLAATIEGRQQMEMLAEYAAQVACNASSLQGELEKLETAYEIGKLLSFGLGMAVGYGIGAAGAGGGGGGGHGGGGSVNPWTGGGGGGSVNPWIGGGGGGGGGFGLFPLLIPFGVGGSRQSCSSGACTVAQPCQTCVNPCNDCKDNDCKDCKKCLECEEEGNFDDVPDESSNSAPTPDMKPIPDPQPNSMPPAPMPFASSIR